MTTKGTSVGGGLAGAGRDAWRAALAALLAVVLSGILLAPSATAHNEISFRVSQGAPSVETNPTIAFGAQGQVYAAYGRDNGGLRDIIVGADQDGWVDDGVPAFTTFQVANDQPGVADWASSDHIPLLLDPAGSLYVAWIDSRTSGTTGTDIRVARSDTAGSSFGASVRVSDFSGLNAENYPVLAVGPSGVIYCAFTDNRLGTSDIWFSRSADQGGTWSANVRVNDVANVNSQAVPHIAVDGTGRIFATWTDQRPGANRILFDWSDDQGATWHADQAIGRSSGQTWGSDVAVGRNDIVYLAWGDSRLGDNGVYLTRSYDHGVTWLPETRVNFMNNAGTVYPRIAVTPGGSVHVQWGGDGTYGASASELWTGLFRDDGTTWGANIWFAFAAYTYSIGVDPSGNIFAIWSQDDGGPNFEVHTRWIDLAPQPPANLRAVAGATGGSVTVTWNPNRELDLGGYAVYRSGPDSAYAQIATLPAGVASFTDIGRATGEWSYDVSAFDRFGHASATNTASVDIGPTTDTRLSALEAKINELNQKLADLQGNVTNLQSQNSNLRTELASATSALTTLKDQIAPAETLNGILLVMVVVLSVLTLFLATRNHRDRPRLAAAPWAPRQPPKDPPTTQGPEPPSR